MEERQEEIVDKATHVFFRYGIKSVTMDDVARHLAISKKTLYQFFSDKNDLVMRMVERVTRHHHTCILGICSKGHNAIDENFHITRFVASELSRIHPSVHFDLEKYHPEAFIKLQRTERDDIHRTVTENMRKGIKQGLYREDLNIDVVAKIYISRFDAVFDGELFPPNEYSFKDVVWEQFRYHIRGVASKKGLDYLDKKMTKEA